MNILRESPRSRLNSAVYDISMSNDKQKFRNGTWAIRRFDNHRMKVIRYGPCSYSKHIVGNKSFESVGHNVYLCQYGPHFRDRKRYEEHELKKYRLLNVCLRNVFSVKGIPVICGIVITAIAALRCWVIFV